MKRCLACLVVLLAAASSVRADAVTNTFLGGPTITIQSSGYSGGVYAGPFQVVDHTQGDVTFKAFCVDLFTTVGFGPDNRTVTIYTPLYALTPTTIPGFSDSAYSDVGNRLAYMIGKLWYPNQSTWDSNMLGAFQAAVWDVIDKKFQLVSAGSTLKSDYNNLLALVGAPGGSGTGTGAYQVGTTYQGGQLLWMNPQGSYQNLITYVPSGLSAQSLVPEPSTVVSCLAGGLLCLGAAARRFRKAPR